MPPSDTSCSTSASLLRRVRNLDPEAWQRLARLYGPLVYRWARHAGLQDADASDVGQDVFQTVAVRIGSFHHGRPGDTFRGWLRTITRNKIGEYLRRRAAQPAGRGGTDAARRLAAAVSPPEDDSLESDDFDANTSLAQRALELMQTDFEPHTWHAFWRATVEGHPTDIIAEELGMTKKAVRQAKFRVLRRLRTELDQLLD